MTAARNTSNVDSHTSVLLTLADLYDSRFVPSLHGAKKERRKRERERENSNSWAQTTVVIMGAVKVENCDVKNV